jgi:hypothetical protein
MRRVVWRARSPSGTVSCVKTNVMPGTKTRPIRYSSAREMTMRRVSPFRYAVIGTTAIAGGTDAMRTQPS